MINESKARIDLLKNHPHYTFSDYNNDINQYTLANIFWLYTLKTYFDMSEWVDYGGVYLNFDNDPEISIPIIKVYNLEKKKILMINNIGHYEEQFKDPYFLVGTGTIEVEIDNGLIDEFYALDLGVDLRHDKSLGYALDFIKKFIDENIPLEEMEILIEEFDQKHELELQRK